jgi:hypothetical protein
MKQRPLRAVATVLIVLAGAACGTGAPSATPTPAAASFEEYSVAFCSAFDALFQAVGNPDTGTASVLSKSLDDAVAAGDVASAERLAATITSKLETGRQQAAAARRWQPAGPTMVQLDRVLVASEAMIAAKRAAAGHAPGAVDPQTAFEQAGGVEAWFAMLPMLQATGATRPAGATAQPCATVPVTP